MCKCMCGLQLRITRTLYITLHSCGHLYHASCLGVSGRDGPSLGITCVVCNKSSAPSGHTGRLPVSVSHVATHYHAV